MLSWMVGQDCHWLFIIIFFFGGWGGMGWGELESSSEGSIDTSPITDVV